jgi:acyl carrier protein
MTDLRAAFHEELTLVAPDLDPATIGDDDHVQEDLGLDSMDFLNLVAALHHRFGLPIPETDYPHLATAAKATAYLAEMLAGKKEGAPPGLAGSADLALKGPPRWRG